MSYRIFLAGKHLSYFSCTYEKFLKLSGLRFFKITKHPCLMKAKILHILKIMSKAKYSKYELF